MGQGSGDQASGNISADRLFLGLRSTDPDAKLGVSQVYIKDTGGGEMTLFVVQPSELGGAVQEIGGLSGAEIIDLIFESQMSWRWSVLDYPTAPVVSGADGDRYIVNTPATGSWTGQEGDVATRVGAGDTWTFTTPEVGWKLWNVATKRFFRWDGLVWGRIDTFMDGLAKFSNGAELDVNGQGLRLEPTGADGEVWLVNNDAADWFHRIDTSANTNELRAMPEAVVIQNTILAISGHAVSAILGDSQGGDFTIERNAVSPVNLFRVRESDGKTFIFFGLDMSSAQINALADPTLPQDAATKAYVDAVMSGVGEWQDSVLSELAVPPGVPGVGDRYLIIAVATGAWVGQEDSIAEWNGASWDFTVPTDGMAVVIDATDSAKLYNGTSWVAFGSFLDHSQLKNLLVGDPHTQYQLGSEKGAASGYAPLDSDSLVPQANLPPSALDRFFGYITSTINITGAGAYQDVDLDAQPVEEGISWDGIDSEIDLLPNATYNVDISANVDKSAGANSIAEVRVLLNAVEVPGSAMGRLVAANNQVAYMGTTFKVVTPAGTPKLKIQFGGGTTNTRLVPGASIATTTPSLQINITREA